MTKSGIGQFARAAAWPLAIAATSAVSVASAYKGEWVFATVWAVLTLAYVAIATGDLWVQSVRMEKLGLAVVREAIQYQNKGDGA